MSFLIFNYIYIFKYIRSELFKTQIKKETLETEIELLENQIKLKKKELCTNAAAVNCGAYEQHQQPVPVTSASGYFVDSNSNPNGNCSNKIPASFKSCSFIGGSGVDPRAPKYSPFSYDEVKMFFHDLIKENLEKILKMYYILKVLKLMNERDTLKHKLYFEKTHRDLEKKELESQYYQLKEDACKEQKMFKEKVARLEEVS